VVNTVGLGPHSLRHQWQARRTWFFDPQALWRHHLTDIASHQFEQFLFFSNADRCQSHFGERCQSRPIRRPAGAAGYRRRAPEDRRTTSGYIRVDWFTPKGLPTWGDGRLIIIGTEGYIELRKYIDIAGRPGHRPSVPGRWQGHRSISIAANTELPFGRQFLADVRDRTEMAMPQRAVLQGHGSWR
jgi:predicted dehydrogenase